MTKTRLAAGTTLVLMFATLVALAPPAGARALHSRSFQMPSGNIGCYFGGSYLRCDILSGMNPEPRGNCELDWTGLTLATHGRAEPTCAGDTVVDRNSPVLDYGHRWKLRGIVCRSSEAGLRCTNDRGHGFFLSRDRWRRF
jgi:hypothetical protein